ncbi:MAG TPA: hypothetical protein VM344_10480 [Vitreimonas sp.]|nr:hypothetical protein [Vitreimonas sp.]
MTSRRLLPVLAAVTGIAVIAIAVSWQAVGGRTDVGIVVDVDSVGFGEVRTFTLRADDGRRTTYRIGRLENEAEFPVNHLVEHMATVERVRVFYREEGDERVAYRLEDAPDG